jgi:hypothetical protein
MLIYKGRDILLQKAQIEKIITRFQEENAKDPNKIQFNGKEYPFELLYSDWLSDWINKITSEPSTALKLAGYCQHLKRWEIPRSSYPMDKNGYHKWRTRLYSFHAEEAEKILQEEKCEEKIIALVRTIVLKKDRLNNPDVQRMEDALCLVTLEHQMKDFAPKYSDEKLTDILKKIIKKMSIQGIELAMNLQHSNRIKSILSDIV